MPRGNIGKPIGSQNQPLTQGAAAPYPLITQDTGANLLPALYPPASAYFQDDGGAFPDWAALLIAALDTTLGVDVTGYSNKTIYFISDTQGTLTIEVLEPDGATWRQFDVIGISTDTLRSYQMEEQATQVRLIFSEAATVSAWITRGVA